MSKQRIRIRLKAFDYALLDDSAEKIVQIARQTGAHIQVNGTGYVSRTEVELRTVAREEGLVTAAFFFLEDHNAGHELGVWLNGTGLSQYHTANDVLTLYAA